MNSMKLDSQPRAARAVDVVVVGAGFAGLYLLHRLRKLGLSTLVLEAGSDVGGTWYWNRYPGSRCDVQSVEYCYSFSEEIQQGWNWSERYAAQPEILRYIQYAADKLDLRRDITFDTRVQSAKYDASARRWMVQTHTGDLLSSRFCIMATGSISLPVLPDIPGAAQFQRDVYHTGRWPHEPVDFGGLRVGIIGTGSSACQSIPLIAEAASQLYVFQRTPNHCVPANNYPLDVKYWEQIKTRYPRFLKKWRSSPSGTSLPIGNRSALEVSEGERNLIYQHLWEVGGAAIQLCFDDLIVDEAANETLAEFVRGKIREIVKDPETAERLMPRAHPMGAKRTCIVTNYYETFNRPNVHLVSTLETPIEKISATGVCTSDREIELDALIFATGFDAITGSLFAIDIRGCEGISLQDRWSDGPSAYLGLMTSGFPNLFIMTGPGSPSVISNVLSSIEQHVDWMANCLEYMRHNGIFSIEASARAEGEWMHHVNEVANGTLFPKAKSWYNGDNIAGKKRVFTSYVAGSAVYMGHLQRVVREGYAGFLMDGQDGSTEASLGAANSAA